MAVDTVNYWAYGMNTNRQEMAGRCAGARALGVATLPGHEMVFSGHCDVRPREHSQVQGVLWVITRGCLAKLDSLEGRPWYYDRDWVTVYLPDGTAQRALCYRMVEPYPMERPGQSYLNCVAQGYLDHGLELNQIDRALALCDRNQEVVL